MVRIKLDLTKLFWMTLPAVIAVVVSYQVFSVNNFDSNRAEIEEQRVIKCSLPLDKKLVQNVFYVAEDIVTAKKQLFNTKKGLYFEGKMYVKTKDFNGREYLVRFSTIDCDSVGYEVTQEFISKT